MSLEILSLPNSTKYIADIAITSDLPLDEQLLVYDSSENQFKYVNTNTPSQSDIIYLRLDGTNLPTDDINLNSNKITNLANPTDNTDAVNKEYVDNLSNNKVAKSGDIMTGDLIINTGTDSFKTLGCDDLSAGSNTFNLLMGNYQNKITYNPSVGPVIMNALNGFTINQNGTDVMRIGKGSGDARIDLYQDVLLNQNFINNVRDPILDKDAVTKIYSDYARYTTATPNLDPTLTTNPTIINGIPYSAIASTYSGLNGPWEAFKNTFSTMSWVSLSATNSSITLIFPYPISMSGFHIIPSTGCRIDRWTIDASNDGISFVIIVPRTVLTFNPLTLARFTFTPNGSFTRWRFISNNANINAGMSMLQWIPTNPDLSLKKCQSGHVPILNTNVGYRGFIPSASSEFSASYLACNAFRQNYVATPGVDGEWATFGVTSNFWLQIKCPIPVRIWKVGLTGRAGSVSTNRITNWRIEGSNDAFTYVTIYTATNPTPIGGVYQEFEIDSISKFAFYRLFAVNAEATSPGLSVFQLFVYE